MATLQRIAHLLRPIRVRLTLWYVALLMVILATFSAFLYVRLAQNLRDETDRALALEAQQIGSTLEMDHGGPFLSRALEQLPAGIVVVLYSPSEARLEASAQGRLTPALPPPSANQQRTFASLTTVSAAVGDDWRVLTTPVRSDGQTIALLQVAQSQDLSETALHQLALQMAVAVPLTLVLAALGGSFLASRALDPIDRITRTAQRISAEDLTQRLHLPPSPDEVGRLAGTFDQMLDRLEQAFSRQRQFTADASHELRTPLAVLAAQTDLALDQARRPEDYRAALREIHQQAEQMAQLLSELLMLARVDSGPVEIDHEGLDLTALVADTVATLTPLAEAGGVMLSAPSQFPAPISGDQARLTQLIVNLVDNALKYTPVGGKVEVRVNAVDGRALLQVTDSGVGIAPEHLPHLFERFYRADAARSRDEGGAGLGLSICQWIATAHEGTIAVHSTPGSGTTFTVSLPLTKAQTAG
jgi:heavy metal sensor kinase